MLATTEEEMNCLWTNNLHKNKKVLTVYFEEQKNNPKQNNYLNTKFRHDCSLKSNTNKSGAFIYLQNFVFNT